MATLHLETQADRDAAALAAVRAERDARLAASDWTQARDAPLTRRQRRAWRRYRRALRDLPASPELDPHAPAWPTPPE